MDAADRHFARILLRDDLRVRLAYEIWRARHGAQLPASVNLMLDLQADWASLAASPEQVFAVPGIELLLADMRELKALVASLTEGEHRRLPEFGHWLPQRLFWEFASHALGVPLEREIPDGPWAARGKEPKRRPERWADFGSRTLNVRLNAFIAAK